MTLDAPFPWFGGKRQVAVEVWARFGDVPNYVEPFAGSLAVLLARPHWDAEASAWRGSGRAHTETVNDLDGCVTNFWRAVKHDPEQTAEWADNPVHELDLYARHLWLHERLKSVDGLDAGALAYGRDKGVLPFAARLTMDAAWYDCRVAGWWAWGLSSWIGDNWCRPKVQLALPHLGDAGQGVNRQLPHLGNAGRGVNRQRPHLGSAGQGVNRQLPHLGDAGMGVNRKRPHLGNAVRGVNRKLPGEAGKMPALRTADGAASGTRAGLVEWFGRLADRLRRVDVCCGDWERICRPTPTEHRGTPCGVFLDPPYSQDVGVDTVYGEYHDKDVSARVREWAIAHGDNPALRIALCGYEGEHAMPDSWECVAWKARGGYANRGADENENAARERIWFSPGCLQDATLFDGGLA